MPTLPQQKLAICLLMYALMHACLHPEALHNLGLFFEAAQGWLSPSRSNMSNFDSLKEHLGRSQRPTASAA